jgi:hypothetical protein
MDKKPDPEDLLPGLEVPIVTPPAGGRCHADPEFLLEVVLGWDVSDQCRAFARMGEADWSNPKLRDIGHAFAEYAGELAWELEQWGACASALLPHKIGEVALGRPRSIKIPTALADRVMAVLLAQPRVGYGRGPRRPWSPDSVKWAIDKEGMSLRAAAQQESTRTGVPLKTIERAMRGLRSTARAHKK